MLRTLINITQFLSISRLIFLSPFRRRRALVPSLVRSVVLEKLVHGRSDGRCCSTRAPANAEAMRWSMYEGTEADFLAPIINVLSTTSRLVVA